MIDLRSDDGDAADGGDAAGDGGGGGWGRRVWRGPDHQPAGGAGGGDVRAGGGDLCADGVDGEPDRGADPYAARAGDRVRVAGAHPGLGDGDDGGVLRLHSRGRWRRRAEF